MQIGAAGKFHFERQDLVDTFVVAAAMQNVGTDTDTDCEVGHHVLRTS